MFGAWQAGAWAALAENPGASRFDLVVGASVGSLNGYAIAGGASPEELCTFWRQPEMARLDRLPEVIRELMDRYPPKAEYACVLTDLFRMKPRVFSGGEITWRHLAASCAVPGYLPFYRIDGRLYGDGGLPNPLPLWEAAGLGAKRIVALHALPEIPSAILRPFVKIFRMIFGHNPPLDPGIELTMILPGCRLGSMHDALHWNASNIEKWIQQGRRDALAYFRAASNISTGNCLER